MRRLLIGIYVLICAGLLFLLLCAGYLALPDVTEWTLDEANLAALTHEELTNDYWQWHPSPDRDLLAIGRTEYTIHKPVLPKLVRPTWGYYIYFRFRVRDQRLRDQLLLSVQSSDRPASLYQRQRADEPLPNWWHPKYIVALDHGDEQVYFFDPAESDVACTTRHYEGTLP
jgi:hypothetical protein